MNYSEYKECTDLIDEYLDTGSGKTLEAIQNLLSTKDGLKERLKGELLKKGEYIKVFTYEDQVEILSDLMAEIRRDEYLAYKVSWMLPYVSDKVLTQVLGKADDVALVRIMRKVNENIRIIGSRFCDLPPLHTTTFFSRMWEKRTWRKIYRKCRRNLKK